MSLAGVTLEGRYTVIRPIARGAVATVYLALDLQGTPYALKIFPKGYEGRADREYKVGELLQHPRINPVLERLTVPHEGLEKPAVLMAYAPGTRLSEWRRDNLTQGLKVFGELLEALAHMHTHGLVHRDVKPDNLMVDREGQARLLDFDLSGPSHEPFKQPVRLGTIAYLSPEQVGGQSPTPASDVYSVGILFHWVVSGELPYQGEPAEVMAAHLRQPMPELIPQPGTGIVASRALLEYAARMTAKNPAERFANAEEALRVFRLLRTEG
ncbi:MAG: serine/threonine-protein kinase [Meiothermus sp.]|nr:serine/threonine-protein kinase [Meiothermus sp.]